MMNLSDISTSGLSDEDKAEFDCLKQQLLNDGEAEEDIRGILGSFICDCLEAQ